MNVKPTGEQIILEQNISSIEDCVIKIIHVAAYRFAEKLSQGKRVLDYGCGSGYGSAQISEVAESVHAVDVSKYSIRYAENHYQRENLKYLRIHQNSPLPFPGRSFDIVLSFQVVEHIFNTRHYLSEIRRVLIPGGLLILVTPDRKYRLFPFQKPWNRWHIHEYGETELQALLGEYFQDVQIRHMSGRKDIVDIEIRRCRKLKWMTLPFTLPFIPDTIRSRMLNLIHKINIDHLLNKRMDAFNFRDSDMTIAEDAQPSLNLVALARSH